MLQITLTRYRSLARHGTITRRLSHARRVSEISRLALQMMVNGERRQYVTATVVTLTGDTKMKVALRGGVALFLPVVLFVRCCRFSRCEFAITVLSHLIVVEA